MAGYLDESFLPAKRVVTPDVVYTPKRKGRRSYRASVDNPPEREAKAAAKAAGKADKEQRLKDLAVGKEIERRNKKERRLEESQFQRQLRAEQALAKRKARARAKSVRKHKRIARKIWHRLV